MVGLGEVEPAVGPSRAGVGSRLVAGAAVPQRGPCVGCLGSLEALVAGSRAPRVRTRRKQQWCGLVPGGRMRHPSSPFSCQIHGVPWTLPAGEVSELCEWDTDLESLLGNGSVCPMVEWTPFLFVGLVGRCPVPPRSLQPLDSRASRALPSGASLQPCGACRLVFTRRVYGFHYPAPWATSERL